MSKTAKNSLPKMTEREFTNQVIKLAKLLGWRVAHFRPARTAKGWRTAVQGDGVGFPDLVMVRGSTIIVAELKVRPNKPTPEQYMWLDAFQDVGARVFIWYPEDWSKIEEVLT